MINIKNIKKFLGLDFYTSKLDQFLAKLRREQPTMSCSQQTEINKYQRIFQLRDNKKQTSLSKKTFWNEF